MIFNLARGGMGDGPVVPRRGYLGYPAGDLRVRGTDPPDPFVVGSLLDELAVARDKEPLQFLLSLLANGRGLDCQLWSGIHDAGGDGWRKHPVDAARMRNVLLLAAARSGWRSPLPVRQGRGIAAHHTALTHIATIARVSVTDDGRVGVRRIDLAVDCGLVTGAERVAEALRDAALTALSNTVHRKPDDAPDIRIHIVRSAEPSGRLGDAAVPTVMAALVNAIFAATGKRAWSLPVDPALLRLH